MVISLAPVPAPQHPSGRLEESSPYSHSETLVAGAEEAEQTLRNN